MSLVYDARDALQGQAGFHALIVGVSAYRYLPPVGSVPTPESCGMTQLSCAAYSAYTVYRWLRAHSDTLSAPLATCRLLLAPTDNEAQREPAVRHAAAATLSEFLCAAREWRADVAQHRDNAALFYFAGHGVVRNRAEQILLMADFNDGHGSLLRNGVNLRSLIDGMAPSRRYPHIGRTQFYFIDACRNMPSQFASYESLCPTPAFDVYLPDMPDDRTAPVFFAAPVGSHAYAEPNTQTFFSKALIRCLQGTAAEPDAHGCWRITSTTLQRTLEATIRELLHAYDAEQQVVVNGVGRDAVLCYLPQPPQAQVQLFLNPREAHQRVQVQVRDGEGALVRDLQPPIPIPYETHLTPGYYQFQVWRVGSQTPDKQAIREIRFPSTVVELEAIG